MKHYQGFLPPQKAFDVYMAAICVLEEKEFMRYIFNDIKKPVAEDDVIKLYNKF